MKRLYGLLAAVLLLVQPALVLSQGNTTGATAAPDHIVLSWTGNPTTTMTVTWRTDTRVAHGFVEYQAGTDVGPKAMRVRASKSDLSTNLGDIRLFSVALTGLSANTKYSYRVGDGQKWSESRAFTTADISPTSVKFLVFGDSQSSASGTNPYSVWNTTIHNAYKANPDAKFMIFTGDLVDTGQSYAHWKAWFAAGNGVIDAIPVMPVCGNHETYGSSSTARPAYLTGQFTLHTNGPAGLKEQAYSYKYGPVHMFALDSQQDEQGHRDMFKLEQAWLNTELSASKSPWTIAYFHKGPYEVHVDRKNMSVRTGLMPVLEKHGVDVVFNGHDHGIGRTYPMKNFVKMAKPSQGTVYIVDGRSGTKSYKEVEKKPWNSFFYNPQDQPNYMIVEATESKLTIRTVKQDGSLLDTYWIDSVTDTCTDTQPAIAK